MADVRNNIDHVQLRSEQPRVHANARVDHAQHPGVILTSRIILAIVLSTVSGFALAQSPAPRAQTNVPAATAQTRGMNADKGLRIADSATMAVKFVTVQPADFMSSKLVGVNVYNNQNK